MGTVQVEDLDDLEEKLSARIERVEEALGITPEAQPFRPISVGSKSAPPVPHPWWRWQLLRLAHCMRWPRLAAWAADGIRFVLPGNDRRGSI